MKSNSSTGRGDNSKSKKARVVILVFILSCSTLLPSIIKIFRRIFVFIEQARNQIQTQEAVITPKVRKSKLSFLYMTSSHPVLHFYQE